MSKDPTNFSSIASFDLEGLRNRSFITSFRGFNTKEVRSFLSQLANQIENLLSEQQQLRQKMELERQELENKLAETTYRLENPELNEEILTAALGKEAARIFRSAHEAALQIRTAAESEKMKVIEAAFQEAESITSKAALILNERSSEAEREAEIIRKEALKEAQDEIDHTRQSSREILEQAEQEARVILQEAQELRTKILSDLVRRRRIMQTQFEQLQAGRATLIEVFRNSRRVIDEAMGDLNQADEKVRIAGEQAAYRAVSEIESSPEELEEALEISRLISKSPSNYIDQDLEPQDLEPQDLEPQDLEPQDSSSSAIDELFARIKAEREKLLSKAQDILDEKLEVNLPGVEDLEKSIIFDDTTSDVEQNNLERIDTTFSDPKLEQNLREGSVEVGEVRIYLEDLEYGLMRKLKRLLQDDQNDLLGYIKIGSLDKKASPLDVLGSTKDHVRRYTQISIPFLEKAALLGSSFVDQESSVDDSVERIAFNLGSSLVSSLRGPLEEVFSQGLNGLDKKNLIDSLNSFYRNWRSKNVQTLAGDYIVEAFSLAMINTTSKVKLSWTLAGKGEDCPSCIENSLAEPIEAGGLYPSGNAHPPLHPGCRCLITLIQA